MYGVGSRPSLTESHSTTQHGCVHVQPQLMYQVSGQLDRMRLVVLGALSIGQG
jgi:hypothetical protein